MTKTRTELMSDGAHFFDCDGTISPYVEEAHGLCVAGVFERLIHQAGGRYSPELFHSMWEKELGRGINSFARVFLEAIDEKTAQRIRGNMGFPDGEDELYKAIEALYEEEYIRFSKDPQNAGYYMIRPGLAEIFERAASEKVPIAVISNANQRVLEATLTATLQYAGLLKGNLKDIFAVVMGKDTVESLGGSAKPDPSAIYCVRKAVEEVLKRPISLRNSIGWGDTPSDYKAFSKAGIAWIVACDNSVREAANDGIGSPDEAGMLRVLPGQNVSVVINRFCDTTGLQYGT